MNYTDKIIIYVIIITSEVLQVLHNQLTRSIVEHGARQFQFMIIHLVSTEIVYI